MYIRNSMRAQSPTAAMSCGFGRCWCVMLCGDYSQRIWIS